MKHPVRRAVVIAAVLCVAPSTFASAGTVAVKYSSCTSLLKRYPAGIAASKAKKKNTKAFVSASQYAENKALDLDGNGIACDAGDIVKTTAGWSAFTLSGEGEDTKALKIPSGQAAIMTVTHDGEDSFTVSTLDKDDEVIDQLVSTAGTYEGTVFVGRGEESSPTAPKSLQVEADGKWTAKVAPASTAPLFSSSKSGTGDAVLRYKGGDASVKVTHDGESTFAVTIYSSKGFYVDLVVSEDGQVDTSFDLPADCYIAINADGNWKLSK